jgi:hypothetical protein
VPDVVVVCAKVADTIAVKAKVTSIRFMFSLLLANRNGYTLFKPISNAIK